MKQERRRRGISRAVAMLLTCITLMSGAMIGASASAPRFPANATPTRVYVDGREVLAGECVIMDSVTYVPLRNFSNLFDDCKISWNAKTRTATVQTADLYMTGQSDAAYITANGHAFYTVGKVENIGGSLYVPIRPLALAFAKELSWNASTRSVELTSVANKRAVAWANYREDEVYWLSRIISAEAKGEPLAGQIAVGNVVLNRVRHKDYPNTIYGVIFDRKHGTQFSPVSFGTIYQTPTESAVVAAKICLEGYSLSDTAIFFLNPRIATNNWIVKNRPYAFTIGNHDFYN